MPEINKALVTTRYYPKLSNFVSVENMPDFLGFLKNGIGNCINNIYVRDFYANISANGGIGSYKFDIVSAQRLDLEILGTGINIVLNPDISTNDSNISIFPIEIYYEWKLLEILGEIKLTNKELNIKEIFELLLEVLDISEELALVEFINRFTYNHNTLNTKIEQFVIDVNFSSNFVLDTPNSSSKISDILAEIKLKSGINPKVVLFQVYLLDSDIGKTKENVIRYFKSFIKEDFNQFLKKVFLPNIKATLKLSAAVEFPRKLLVPVYDEFGVNPYDPNTNGTPYTVIPEDSEGFPKVQMKFGEAEFYADTEQGLGYSMELALSTNTPAKIGNTGFIIDIHNLKLDLSKTKNIPEADLDGRPADFMGAYIQEATIAFPANWNHDKTASTGVIKAKDLLIGNGGISGTISLSAKSGITDAPLLKLKLGQDFSISLDTFFIQFHQNSILRSDIKGTLTIPGVKHKKDDGTYDKVNPVEIFIDVFIGNNGEFKINAQPVGGLHFYIENVARIDITSLSLGKENDKFYIAIAGGLDFSELAGKINGVESDFPTNIPLKKLKIWEDGKMEFDAGVIALPRAISLKIGPAKLAVTSLLFSSTELFYKEKKTKYVKIVGTDILSNKEFSLKPCELKAMFKEKSTYNAASGTMYVLNKNNVPYLANIRESYLETFIQYYKNK